MEIKGRREVGEAVLITALCAIVTEAVSFAAQKMREADDRRTRRKKKAKKKAASLSRAE